MIKKKEKGESGWRDAGESKWDHSRSRKAGLR